jgi:hypothetical protein
MTRTPIRRLATGLATLLVLYTPAAAAASATDTHPGAAAQPRSLYAPSVLVLTVAQGTDPEPVQRAVALRCTPRGGDHPAPERACRALDRVDGDFTRLTPGRWTCTLEYRPLTVTARGVWRGRLVGRTATYPNRCALLRATGKVFAF